jgi:hypothetical protein
MRFARVEMGLRVPIQEEPSTAFSLDWQTDGTTRPLGDLFDVVMGLLP